jgi:hypothetical protein
LRRAASEHGIAIGRFLRNPLQHIPVLNDLSVRIEPKNVDASPIVIFRPLLVAVQDNELSFSENPLNSTCLPGYSRVIRSKHSMNASLPSATDGLC